MRKKALSLISTLSCFVLLFASVGFADIPAPPVNQSLGFPDTIFNNLVEAECRLCHDDPVVVGPTPNVDRHHLLYGSPLPQGECSVNGNLCLSDEDCDAAICSQSPIEACSIDDDCDKSHLGETCGEVCIGETVAPILDGNQDGSNDSHYGCLNCHEQDTTGGVTNFLVERNCLQCHIQVPGEGSVHHLLPVAQGGDSPLGDPLVGDCTPCHGTIVDDIGDGHAIPSYNPSFVTPAPSGGNGDPVNSEGNGAGACDYCHSTGTGDPTSPGLEGSGVLVYGNSVNHHNTGVYRSETGVINDNTCKWCHDLFYPIEDNIRYCEGCHGYESLHNIQADSDGDCDCTPGQEEYGFGHIGKDDPGGDSDCWGCHGFSFASAAAPGAGPTVPSISSIDPMDMTVGTGTQVTLIGTGFTNTIGAFEWISNIVMTADDGSSTILTPDAIDTCLCKVTISASTAPGNYTLQAVKGDAVSNPVVISVTPAMVISSASCGACSGVMTIDGSGFGDAPPEGALDFINVEAEIGVDVVMLEIVSWSDTQIKVNGACNAESITVNGLYASATLSTAPEVVITGIECEPACKATNPLAINGSGFGDQRPGDSDDVMQGGVPLSVTLWNDTEIQAVGNGCSGTIVVNALDGSATYQP